MIVETCCISNFYHKKLQLLMQGFILDFFVEGEESFVCIDAIN